MRWYAILPTVLPILAHAAVITTPFNVSGDFAVGSEENVGVSLPQGGTSTVLASLNWGEPFASMATPGHPIEIVLTFASLSVFDASGAYVDSGVCAVTGFADSPVYANYSSCAPTNVQEVASTSGISETDRFNFSFPSSPGTLFFNINAFAVCLACIVQEDDAGGDLSGVISTSTDPPAIPEPVGLAVLGAGLVGLGLTTSQRRRRPRPPQHSAGGLVGRWSRWLAWRGRLSHPD